MLLLICQFSQVLRSLPYGFYLLSGVPAFVLFKLWQQPAVFAPPGYFYSNLYFRNFSCFVFSLESSSSPASAPPDDDRDWPLITGEAIAVHFVRCQILFPAGGGRECSGKRSNLNCPGNSFFLGSSTDPPFFPPPLPPELLQGLRPEYGASYYPRPTFSQKSFSFCRSFFFYLIAEDCSPLSRLPRPELFLGYSLSSRPPLPFFPLFPDFKCLFSTLLTLPQLVLQGRPSVEVPTRS